MRRRTHVGIGCHVCIDASISSCYRGDVRKLCLSPYLRCSCTSTRYSSPAPNPAYLILDIVNNSDPGSETRAPVLQAFHVISLVSQLRRRARFLGHCNRFERSRSTRVPLQSTPKPPPFLLQASDIEGQVTMAGLKRQSEGGPARGTKRPLPTDQTNSTTPTDKPATSQPRPVFTSALLADEGDFPRGGGTTLTPLEYKEVRDEGRKEAEKDVEAERKKRRLNQNQNKRGKNNGRSGAGDEKKEARDKDAIRESASHASLGSSLFQSLCSSYCVRTPKAWNTFRTNV